MNCRPAIFHDNVILFFHPGKNLFDNRARLFKTRVIRCNDDKIRQPLSNFPHHGPLAGIPVATAPKDADQPSFGEAARCFERALQAIRLMGVIQNDAVIPATGIQPLKAPGNSRDRFYPLFDADHVHPKHKAHSNGRESIIDAEHPRRLQQNGELRPLLCHNEAAACTSELNPLCRDVGFLLDAVGQHLPCRGRDHGLSKGIICVDSAMLRIGKQDGLCIPIVFKITVEIQVILRQIREDRALEMDPIDAL